MNRRIRIAHLITNFPVGGAQDYLLQIVQGLDQSKFEPFIVGHMEGEWVEKVKSMPGVTAHDIPALGKEISPWKDLKSVFQIRRFCKENDIDILHTHSSKPGIVGRLGGSLAGVPSIVHTIHGFSFHGHMPAWRRGLFIAMERLMSRYTTTLLCLSKRDRETADRLHISARESVQTFYYGVDFTPFADAFDRDEIRKSLGFDSSNSVIGFTGRFSRQKGLTILLEAFQIVHVRFPNIRLLLVGDGEFRSKLEDDARRRGIADAVVITGFRSDISRLLAAMDIFVMTSLWEGLSRSLAEAMYARLPIIATNVGGTSDVIQNGETGWLIKVNSVDATVDALLDALANPDRACRMADRGYQWARKEFDPPKMQERISRLYEGLMNRDGRQPRG